LDGSAGIVSFQVGANVGQTISLDLSQSMSAAKIGGGLVQKGQTVGTVTGLSLDNNGAYASSGATITAINVISDGKGGYTFTDQNGQGISGTAATAVFGAGATSGTGTPVAALVLGSGVTGAGTTAAQQTAITNAIA
ncbi:hypothetical protein M3640_22235, partial [Bacillus velezensis]|nr:hypothetical protein [Bacillus velezensis]